MTKYFSVKIENLEPLRIGDASTSQRGQTDTLLYIPGTVIRGIVLHGIQKEKDFETYKRLLLSDQVRFLNAYPAVKKDKKWIPLLPSIRGFREQKGGKEIASEMFGGEAVRRNEKCANRGILPARGADFVVSEAKAGIGSESGCTKSGGQFIPQSISVQKSDLSGLYRRGGRGKA